MKNLYIASLALLFLAGCEPQQQAASTASAAGSAIPYDSLQTVLVEVLAQDQGIREKLMAASSPEEEMKLVPEMHRIDSANMVLVGEILEKYGWLPQSKLGEEAASSLFYVVQHSSTSTMEKYFPMLQQRAQEGEASKVHAAMMEDRILMWQGKKQIYGTQASNMSREDGEMAIWPIEDAENVNKRRQEAGFPTTVEENAQRMNAIYDPKAELRDRNQN
jgi:hypothetical protein